ASRDQLEAFYGQFGDTLLRIGFTDPPRLPSVMRMFRAVFDRAELSAHELAALRGLASQARWAADKPPEALPPAEADQPDASTNAAAAAATTRSMAFASWAADTNAASNWLGGQ